MSVQLIEKIKNLPENLQKHLEDYVDFLAHRDQPEDNDLVLNTPFIEELRARKEAIEKNPDKKISLQELKNKLTQKYNWDVQN